MTEPVTAQEKRLGFVVYAKDEVEAKKQAIRIFETRFCAYNALHSGGTVIYCKKLDKKDDELVLNYINMEKSNFMNNLAKIKRVLSQHKVEEVYELMEYLNRKTIFEHEEFNGLGMSFYQCSLFPKTGSVFLFDNDGEPLLSISHVSKIFLEWKPKDKTVWLVMVSPQ